MSPRAMFSFFSWALLLIAIIPNAASYNKYGRTCKDIGCRSDETCVMAEDPCTGYTDKCGRYPTCRRTSDASCTSMVCGENEYCKSENGAPKCVRKSTGLENDDMRTRTVPKRQTSYPTETDTRGSSDTFKNSDGQSSPARSSGYPSSGSSGYPSSGSSRYPSSQSGYPSSGSSGYPSSGSSNYPSRESSGYPTGSGYPGGNSGSSGYPDNSRNPYGEETVRRTGINAVNAGYPSPGTSAYPQGNPSYRNNYPGQNAGYPYNNQHPSYPNQGYSNGYPQNYPQGGYQGQNYMTTTKRPGIRDQLTNFARNVAEKVLTQTILDRVTGRHQ
ncbi:PREDICTED: prespore protein Dp87-like isoform X2 [Vollenhovia emeryi]|uniref:prespore protein Dp87-like isoform X2 n=1 Tax=Vollenhovia emeryi TaxID=411798 RepID=UPI0005F554CD|nr:PREDICTED: prespore protein Dp87-like isoform X2 [Vollenhovia emeryi]